MKNRMDFSQEEQQDLVPDEMLKTTTLIYLLHAVKEEQYEEATELIGQARYFGATPKDINAVIFEAVLAVPEIRTPIEA